MNKSKDLTNARIIERSYEIGVIEKKQYGKASE